ncbi:ATP-grasp domain-containing protein [Candidatus Magnetomoraceae bacterium gMMP-15]
MQRKKINILFTSVGRRVELLRTFRQAYRKLDIEGKIICTDIDPLAPAIQEADTYYLTPRTLDPEFVSAIIDICRKEDVCLVFPLIDPDIPVLAQGREKIEATKAKVVVVPDYAVKATSDKWKTYCFLKKIGIATPHSWLPEDVGAAELIYPVFLKPRFGSAAKDTFRINNGREFEFFIEYVDRPIIQEYLDGAEITNDVICDFQGKVLSVVSRKRIEVRWGEVAKGITVYDPVITDGCIQIAKAINAIGPVTIQCMIKNDQPIFTEINARYGGGAPLGIAAGVPSPQWYISLAAGKKVTPPQFGLYKMGLCISRYDQAFFLSSEDILDAESHRI